jgi:hypothetical protein
LLVLVCITYVLDVRCVRCARCVRCGQRWLSARHDGLYGVHVMNLESSWPVHTICTDPHPSFLCRHIRRHIWSHKKWWNGPGSSLLAWIDR